MVQTLRRFRKSASEFSRTGIYKQVIKLLHIWAKNGQDLNSITFYVIESIGNDHNAGINYLEVLAH